LYAKHSAIMIYVTAKKCWNALHAMQDKYYFIAGYPASSK